MRRLITGLLLLLTGFCPSFWVHSAVLNINYTVTDSTISDGGAAGTIRDGTTQIGNWSVTSFSFTRKSPSVTWTPSIVEFSSNANDNSYQAAGVGIRMQGNGQKEDGVTSFRYTLSYSLTSAALAGGYVIENVSFLGKFPNTVQNYGPAFSTGTGGSITVSGFSGLGRVSDPTDTLQAADGLQFSSGTNLPGWNPDGNANDKDWAAASVQWSLTVPDSSSLTYSVDYRDQTWSAANESTAFTLNIVPEPSVGCLLLLGTAWVLERRRRKTSGWSEVGYRALGREKSGTID